MKLLDDLGLVDDQFTLRDGMLVYMWSRIATIDEIGTLPSMSHFSSVTSWRPLYIADMKVLPCVRTLRSWIWTSWVADRQAQWCALRPDPW
jgi:hypothetical protein